MIFKKLCLYTWSIIILILNLNSYASDSFDTLITKKNERFTLVLSGGGARGFAQIGVLYAFEEAGIKPSLIVATSMGAIIGSMYSAGVSVKEIETILTNVNWNEIFSNQVNRRKRFVVQKDQAVSYLFELRFDKFTPKFPNSISHGQAIFDILSPVIAPYLFRAGLNFDSLQIPLRIVAADILTGNSIVFSKGDLVKIVRASCSVPFAFNPIEIDSMLLVDGGLTENIPIKTAREISSRIIVAVDVTSPLWKKDELDNPVHLYDQIVAMNINRQKRANSEYADIIIKPDLSGFKNSNFSNPDSLIKLGYEAAKRQISNINSLIGKKNSLPIINSQKISMVKIDFLNSEQNIPRDTLIELYADTNRLKVQLLKILSEEGYSFSSIQKINAQSDTIVAVVNPGIIKNIIIKGKGKGKGNSRNRLIKVASGLKPGEILMTGDIKRSLSSLHATSLFDNINIYADSSLNIVIDVREKNHLRSNFGLRFDDYNLLEGFIQPIYDNLFGIGLEVKFHMQYGKLREKYATNFSITRPLSRNVAGTINVNSYISRERVIQDSTYIDPSDTLNLSRIKLYNERSLRKMGTHIFLGTQIGRIFAFKVGLKIEKYQTTRSLNSSLEDIINPEFKEGIKSLMLKLYVDNLDRTPFPKNGQKHFLGISGASDRVGGDKSYLNFQSSLNFYHTFADKHTISTLGIFDWANSALPPVERIFLGGNLPVEQFREIGVLNRQSFMGLESNAISGDIALAVRGGYRYTIAQKLFLDIILNWGLTWNIDNLSGESEFGLNKATINYFVNNAPLGLGIGISLNTILGPIKLFWGRIISGGNSYQFNINRDNVIYFSAGHDF